LTRSTSRVLAWDGCINVRELGGLPLEGGGETRCGVAVRADSIRTLTDEGWRAVAAYGVRVAVDLRGDDELEDDPPAELPIDVVRFPMPGNEVPVVWEWPSMQVAYLGLLDRFRRELAGAAMTVSRAEAPVVIHCQGGRDRTGLASALILRLAGVPLEAIAADHALSDENWAPHSEEWYAEAPDEWERERRRRVTQPAGKTMADVLAGLDVREYLAGGGVSTTDLDTLVVKLCP
jgi:protein-tyrosine phosphatase